MNDYWNDPDDYYPEPPECCDSIMNVDINTGVCYCPFCHKRIEPTVDDIEPCFMEDDYREFVSYVGTDRENDDVTDSRLSEIFTCQPRKELLTRKEFVAVEDNIQQSFEDCDREYDARRERTWK